MASEERARLIQEENNVFAAFGFSSTSQSASCTKTPL